MLRLGNANAIVIQGLIAPKGLDCLKALISWEFENKPEGGGEGGEGEGGGDGGGGEGGRPDSELGNKTAFSKLHQLLFSNRTSDNN